MSQDVQVQIGTNLCTAYFCKLTKLKSHDMSFVESIKVTVNRTSLLGCEPAGLTVHPHPELLKVGYFV